MSIYDAFTHLSRSLFIEQDDLMSMLTIYCDDSGTDDHNRVAVVAGWIGQVRKWEQFTKVWKTALKDFGVNQMHRSKLEAFKGEFERTKGWNEKKRAEFLQRVHPIIRTYAKVPIGSAVIKKDFEAVMPDEVKKMVGGVYGWCAQECIVAVGMWCEHTNHRHPVRWVLEAGTTGHGQLEKGFEAIYDNSSMRDKCHLKGWSFEDKSVRPLQAADVLAYEVFKQVDNQIVDKGTKHPIRISMRHLMHATTDGRYLKYWNRERLLEWLEMWNARHIR